MIAACTASHPRIKSLNQIRSARDCHFAWTKKRGADHSGWRLNRSTMFWTTPFASNASFCSHRRFERWRRNLQLRTKVRYRATFAPALSRMRFHHLQTNRHCGCTSDLQLLLKDLYLTPSYSELSRVNATHLCGQSLRWKPRSCLCPIGNPCHCIVRKWVSEFACYSASDRRATMAHGTKTPRPQVATAGDTYPTSVDGSRALSRCTQPQAVAGPLAPSLLNGTHDRTISPFRQSAVCHYGHAAAHWGSPILREEL